MSLLHKKFVLLAACAVAAVLFFVSLQWGLSPSKSDAEYRAAAQLNGSGRDWVKLVGIGTEWANNYPASPLAYAALGDGYRGQEQHPAAVAAYEKSLSLDAKNAQVWEYYGVELINVGRAVDAAGACGNSINLNPGLAEAWFCEAVAQAILGDGKKLDMVAVELEHRSEPLHRNLKNLVADHACATQKNKLGKAWCPK